MRLGIRIARPKYLAVNGMTALSMAPSRTCRCQSSGFRMVMRLVMSDLAAGRAVTPAQTDRGRGDGLGLPRRSITCAMDAESCCSVSCGSTSLGQARCENFSSPPAVPKSRFFPNFGHQALLKYLFGGLKLLDQGAHHPNR